MNDVHGVFANESGQRGQAGGNKGVAHQAGQAGVNASDAAADHRSNEGLFQFEDNAVEAGLGDAHDSGKA